MAQDIHTMPIYDDLDFYLEYKCGKLILHIKQNNMPFIFENELDKACKKWLQDNKPKDKLDTLIKKQGGKYYICKPLIVESKNNDTKSNKPQNNTKSSDNNTETKESQNNTKSNIESNKTNANKSSECYLKSKRKTIYIKDELSFKNCVFCGEVKFEYISFCALDFCLCSKSEGELKDSNQTSHISQSLRIDFQHCEFRDKAFFTNCEFNGNVFFNHAIFHKYADFHESIFNGIVSFYNAEFKVAPNFSTCVFSKIQGTDFINAKIENLKFATIKDFINEYQNDKTYKDEIASAIDSKDKITKTHKIRYASNARDSFRTIKNVLIENNNLLDALAWHKLELYAKEQELKLQKPCLLTSAKKWADFWQLKLYRKTSEHHTDLLKILSWFIILVGSFAAALFFERDFFNEKIWWSILWGSLSIALCLSVMFEKIKFFRFFTLLSFVPFVWLLTWNPKYIFGVANLFGSDKCQNDWFVNLLMSIYSVFFILVIFSLQKTARKNSIIPS